MGKAKSRKPAFALKLELDQYDLWSLRMFTRDLDRAVRVLRPVVKHTVGRVTLRDAARYLVGVVSSDFLDVGITEDDAHDVMACAAVYVRPAGAIDDWTEAQWACHERCLVLWEEVRRARGLDPLGVPPAAKLPSRHISASEVARVRRMAVAAIRRAERETRRAA